LVEVRSLLRRETRVGGAGHGCFAPFEQIELLCLLVDGA
jgi:hypothetical protein